MPPPAVHEEVGRCRVAANVAGACLPVCPEENTGMTVQDLDANMGVRQDCADATTLSSGSQNLLARPFTCM